MYPPLRFYNLFSLQLLYSVCLSSYPFLHPPITSSYFFYFRGSYRHQCTPPHATPCMLLTGAQYLRMVLFFSSEVKFASDEMYKSQVYQSVSYTCVSQIPIKPEQIIIALEAPSCPFPPHPCPHPSLSLSIKDQLCLF